MYTARIHIQNHAYGEEIVGEGDSPEEAMDQCLKKVREHVSVEKRLTEDVSIPSHVFQKMPPVVPEGQRFLLVMEYDDDDDNPTGPRWRIFAVTCSSFELRELRTWQHEERGEIEEVHQRKFDAGNIPIQYNFEYGNLDIAEPEIHLPPHSKEFVDGKWVDKTIAKSSFEQR